MLLEMFRTSGQRAAFVLDEFGSVMGMVTLIDLMEAIVGDDGSLGSWIFRVSPRFYNLILNSRTDPGSLPGSC